MSCIFYDVNIKNDVDGKIRKAITSASSTSIEKRSIISTYFDEDNNTDFRKFVGLRLKSGEETTDFNKITNEFLAKNCTEKELEKLINLYYQSTNPNTNDFISGTSTRSLFGFSSQTIKELALNHCADLLREYYISYKGNANLSEESNTKLKQAAINSTRETIIKDFIKNLKKLTDSKELINADANYQDKYEKYETAKKAFINADKNNLFKSIEDKRAVHSAVDALLAEAKLAKLERSNIINRLSNELTKDKSQITFVNTLALYNIVENPDKTLTTTWFTEVFSNPNLSTISRGFRELTEDEKVAAFASEDFSEWINEDADDSIDLMAKNWDNAMPKSYYTGIGDRLKLYLSGIPRLTRDGEFDKSNPLGVITYFDNRYVINNIINAGPFYDVQDMISKIKNLSNIVGLEGFRTIVDDINGGRINPNWLYNELSSAVITKIQAHVTSGLAIVEISNNNARPVSRILYNIFRDFKNNFRENYSEEQFNNINSAFNKKDYNTFKKLASEYLQSILPTINHSLIDNFIYHPDNGLEEYQIILNTINACKIISNKIIDERREIAKTAYANKTTPDYSSLDYDSLIHNSQLIKFANKLVNYSPVDVELNSYNTEGNMASDLLPSSRITRILEQLTYTENIEGHEVETGLQQLLDEVLRCPQYRYSPLFFGNNDINGINDKSGLFVKDNAGNWIINKNAKDKLRISLFDGIGDRSSNSSASYATMTSMDFVATMLSVYTSPIKFHDYSNVNAYKNKCGIFFKTPSDAPKNFVAQVDKLTGDINIKKALHSILLNDLNLFVNELSNISSQETIDGVVTRKIKTNTDGLFEYRHFTKDGIIKDGKLTGKAFKFTKLFTVNGFNVADVLENDATLSLYGQEGLVDTENGVINFDKCDWIDIDNTSLNKNEQGNQIENPIYKINEDKVYKILKDIVKQWYNTFESFTKDQYNTKYKSICDAVKINENDSVSVDLFVECMFNNVINNIELGNLFEGDNTFYKDDRTILKRLKEDQASGKPYGFFNIGDGINKGLRIMSDENILKNLGIVTEFEVKEWDGNRIISTHLRPRNAFRAVTVKNTVKTSKSLVDKIKQELKEILLKNNSEEFSEEQAQFIADKYAYFKSDDAQSWITYDEWLRRVAADGSISQYKDLIEEINKSIKENRKINLANINARIQVQKNVYYDLGYDEQTKTEYPRFIKNAEFVLIPTALEKGSSLYDLYQIMHDNDISQINTEEADKAAKSGVMTLWDEDGNVSKEFKDNITAQRNVNTYYYRYLYRQQEVPSHLVDKENRAGIQILKKILDNANLSIPVIKSSVDSFVGAYTANIRDSFNSFTTKMNWTVKDGYIYNKDGEKLTQLDFNKFYDKAILEAQRSGLDTNFLDYLTPDESGYVKMPNFMNNVSIKLESIAQSLFNNSITRQKLPGWHAAQVSNVGFSKKLKYHPEEVDKNGKVTKKAYAEIMIPKWFKYDGPLSDEELLKKLNEEPDEKSILTQIGYRIPTEGKQSICEFKIVGFIDDVYDSTIIVPDEWVAQTGSDFDVDSVYGIVPEIYFDADGIPHKIEYDLSTDNKATFRRYKNYIRRNATSNDIKGLKDLVGYEQESTGYNEIAKIRDLLSYNKFKELDVYSQLSREQRNNVILDSIKAIIEDESSREENYASSNFADISLITDIYNEYLASNKNGLSIYNPFTQIEFRDNAMSGAQLKAMSVTRDTFNSVCNKGKAVLDIKDAITVIYNFRENNNTKYEELVKRYGKDNVKLLSDNKGIEIIHRTWAHSNDNRNVVGKLVTVYSSETTAHILDAIKTGSIFNENKFTFGTFKTLIDLGTDYETAITFLMNNGITLINNQVNNIESIYDNTVKGSPIILAYKQFAKDLGLKVGKKEINNYTPIAKVRELLNKYTALKEKLHQLFPDFNVNDDIFKFNFPLNKEIYIQRLTKELSADATPEQIADFELTNKAIDLAVICTFDKIHNTSTKVEKLIRCTNPDRFGAKQSIQETRDVVNTIEKYSRPNSKIGNTLKVNGKPIISELYGENSFYPYLKEFYDKVTKNSILVYSSLFDLESDTFAQIFEKFKSYIGKSSLNDIETRQYKNYLVSTCYKNAKLLVYPITIAKNRFITIDSERAGEYLNNSKTKKSIVEQEHDRVYGINIEETGNFEIQDINNPTEEEITRFNRLSPAQKVLFIVKTFTTDAGFFKNLEVTLFNETEIKRRGFTYNKIKFNDISANKNELISEFNKVYFSSNPLIRLAAIDLVKYAFIVEGFNFKKGSISKIISNDALLHFSDDAIYNIIDDIKDGFNKFNYGYRDIGETPEQAQLHFFDLFVRSHSSIVPKTVINSASKTLYDEWKVAYKETEINGERILFITKNLENLNTLFKNNEDEDELNKYIRVAIKTGKKEGPTVLYKRYRTTDEGTYYYPLNLLEENEYYEYSINNENNKHFVPGVYESLIEERINGIDIKSKYHGQNAKKEFDELTKDGKIEKNIYVQAAELISDEHGIDNIINNSTNLVRKRQFEVFKDKIIAATKEGNNIVVFYPGNKVRESFIIPNNKNISIQISQTLDYIDENGEEKSIKVLITRFKPDYRSYLSRFIQPVKGMAPVYVEDLDISEITAAKEAKDNNNTSTDTFYRIQVEEIEDTSNNTNNETDESMYSSTGDIEETTTIEEVQQTTPAGFAKTIINAIKKNKYVEMDIALKAFRIGLFKDGINPNLYTSIKQYEGETYELIRRFYREYSKTISDMINNFELDGIKGLNNPELYEYLIKHPEYYHKVASLLLEAKNFGKDIAGIEEVNYTSSIDEVKNAIESVKRDISSVRNNPIIQEGFKNLIDIYLASTSTNRLVREGIVKPSEMFGDISKSDLLISDTEDINNTLIQLTTKYVDKILNNAKMFEVPEAIEKFKKELNEITEGKSYDYNRIIDEFGRLKTYVREDYIKKRTELQDAVNKAQKENGISSKEYVYAKLALDKWKSVNVEQPCVQEYYIKDVELREKVLKECEDLYLEWNRLNNELRSNARGYTEANIKDIRTKIQALTTIVPSLSEKEKEKIKKFKTFKQESAKLRKQYFTRQETDEFRTKLAEALKTINDYRKHNQFDTLEECLTNETFKDAYSWLEENTNYTLDEVTRARINEAIDVFKGGNTSRNAVLEELFESGIRHDRFNIPDGRKFTKEEIAKLKKSVIEAYDNEFGEKQYDAKPISMVSTPDSNVIFTKDFYDLFNSAKDKDIRKQRLELINKINPIIRKCIDFRDGYKTISGGLSIKALLALKDEELELLANCYEQLENLKENNRTKQEKESITPNITIKYDTASYNLLKDAIEKNCKSGTQKEILYRIINSSKKDKSGNSNPNFNLFGYIVPNKNLESRFIDSVKTNANIFLNQNVEYVPTEHYRSAKKEAIENGTFDEWFDENHVYNPYTYKWEPLKIWTTLNIKEGSELDGYEYLPKGDYYVSTVKPEYANKKYTKRGNNYNKDTGEYNVKGLTKQDEKMIDLLYNTITKYNLGYSANAMTKNGYMPARYKPLEDKTIITDAVVGALGFDFKPSHDTRFDDDVSYDSYVPRQFDMMRILGNKESVKIEDINRLEGESDETFAKRLAKHKEEVQKAKEENLKIHGQLIDRDYESIMLDFIEKAVTYEAKTKALDAAHVTLQWLKDNNAYKLDKNNKVQKEFNGYEDLQTYKKTNTKKAYDLFNNWTRKVLYDEFKKNTKLSKSLAALQNFASAKYMMLNFTTAVTNVGTGFVNICGEQWARRFFDTKDLSKGVAAWQKNALHKLGHKIDDGYDKGDLYTFFAEKFNVIDYDAFVERRPDEKLNNYIKRINDGLYIMQSNGEDFMQNSVLYAMLKSNRFYRQNGKLIFGSYEQYLEYQEELVLKNIIAERPELKQKYETFKSMVKHDVDEKFKFITYKKSFTRDFLDFAGDKELTKEYIKQRKELRDKKVREEFEKFETLESQWKYNNDTRNFELVNNSQEYVDLFSEFRGYVIDVNKYIHGVYDKAGAAYIESNWAVGSMLMQFKKHLYPGIMKRYRGLFRNNSYYNENTHEVRKGSYVSLMDFIYTSIKPNGDEKLTTLKAVQSVFKNIVNVTNYANNWNLLDTWEQDNIRRCIGDLCGTMAAILFAIAIFGLTDDDDISDSNGLSTLVYIADRLYNESILFTVKGLYMEVKTNSESPIVAWKTIDTLYKAMDYTYQWITDPNYESVYKSGAHKGENKILVNVFSNVPIYRQLDRMQNMAKNNKAYKIGDSNANLKFAKRVANVIAPEE